MDFYQQLATFRTRIILSLMGICLLSTRTFKNIIFLLLKTRRRVLEGSWPPSNPFRRTPQQKKFRFPRVPPLVFHHLQNVRVDNRQVPTDEDLLMKQSIHEEMSELPIDSVCSTSFDNDKEMDRDFHVWRRFQQKRMVREDGAEFLKSKIAELEKTMSLEKEQYENEIELLKYEKQVCLYILEQIKFVNLFCFI